MQVTHVLLEHGSQVVPVDDYMHTPLHEAYKQGDTRIHELLVSAVVLHWITGFTSNIHLIYTIYWNSV